VLDPKNVILMLT